MSSRFQVAADTGGGRVGSVTWFSATQPARKGERDFMRPLYVDRCRSKGFQGRAAFYTRKKKDARKAIGGKSCDTAGSLDNIDQRQIVATVMRGRRAKVAVIE
jgi:hypothetical protein